MPPQLQEQLRVLIHDAVRDAVREVLKEGAAGLVEAYGGPKDTHHARPTHQVPSAGRAVRRPGRPLVDRVEALVRDRSEPDEDAPFYSEEPPVAIGAGFVMENAEVGW